MHTMKSPKHFILSFLVILHFAGTISCLEVFNYTLCKRKDFGSDSFVCVCTEGYCDAFNNKESKPLTNKDFAVYTSSKEGARFELNIGQILPNFSEREDVVLLHVDETKKYQEIIGFGGAFTGNLEHFIYLSRIVSVLICYPLALRSSKDNFLSA